MAPNDYFLKNNVTGRAVTSTIPLSVEVFTPDRDEDKFAAEVYRGMQQIASGLGMIIAAWGRKHALKAK